MSEATGRAELLAALDVSRETTDRLDAYAALLARWNPAINLVSKSTIPDLWTRHIADSAQLAAFARPQDGLWLDLGSGGGLPGIVLATLFAQTHPGIEVAMVESDGRKATFLRTAIRELGLSARVENHRIENIPPQGADVVTARAFAPLDKALGFAAPHLAASGRCLFLKGAAHGEEIEVAKRSWRFQCEARPSKTNPEAVILQVEEIRHV